MWKAAARQKADIEKTLNDNKIVFENEKEQAFCVDKTQTKAFYVGNRILERACAHILQPPTAWNI